MRPAALLHATWTRVLTAFLAALAVGVLVVVAAAATFAENIPAGLFSHQSAPTAAASQAGAVGPVGPAASAQAPAIAASPTPDPPAPPSQAAVGQVPTKAVGAGVKPLANAGTIAQGVHVGVVDLTGMDEATARATLTAAFAYLSQGAVTVTAGAATTAITYAEINRHLDVDAAVAAAFGSTDGASVVPVVVFDQAGLTQRITDFATSSATVAVNARAIRTKLGFSTVAAQMGQTFDATDVLPHLISQLSDANVSQSTAIGLAVTETPPTITDAMAQTARAAAAAMNQPVVLANDGDTWTIPVILVHAWINFSVPDGTSIQIVFNDVLIQKALAGLAKQINRDPVSASWAFSPKGVTVVPGKNGRVLDVDRTTRRMDLFLQGRGAGTIPFGKKFGPTVNSTPPALTTEEAQKQASKFQLLSTWTTFFQPAGHNGFGANIWVPAGYLDNQVVQPGQLFSFWDRVGEVSIARGYKLGGAIVNGHTEEGVAIGGGICSTSTTLFNAALRAGLQMGERSNHYYYITRYPVGLDATVSKTSGGGQQDMTFTNDTQYPILIKSFKTGGSVTFSLYGIPTGRTVTFSTPIITNYVPATSEIVHVSTLPAGRLVRIEYPDDGFNASVTAFVRDANGHLISNRTYFSHYGMVQGVQYLGDPLGKPLQVPSYAPGAQGG